MDIVKPIKNARLTLSVLLFLIVAGRAGLSLRAEGGRAGRRHSDHVCQPGYQGISPEDSERLLLRPVETTAQEPQGSQGDEVERLSRAAATSSSSSIRRSI
jgi:multidrug efflux pump